MLFVYLFMMYAVVYMTKSMFSSAMATIVEEGFMTKSQTGLINAVFWLVYALFQVVGGFAADKYSPHKLITIGLVGAIIANIVIYLIIYKHFTDLFGYTKKLLYICIIQIKLYK